MEHLKLFCEHWKHQPEFLKARVITWQLRKFWWCCLNLFPLKINTAQRYGLTQYILSCLVLQVPPRKNEPQVKTLHSKKFACPRESIWKWLPHCFFFFFLPQFTGIVVKMWSRITPSNKLLDFSRHPRRICKLLPRPWLFLPGCFFST